MTMNRLIMVTLLCVMFLSVSTSLNIARAETPEKFNVYHNGLLIKEFPKLNDAITEAKKHPSSYVEHSVNRSWVWNNFPMFKIFDLEQSQSVKEFNTFFEALKVFNTLSNANLYNVNQKIWVMNNYTNFKVYQEDETQKGWEFAKLEDAKKLVETLPKSYILDLNDNKWIWDNYTHTDKLKKRVEKTVYRILQNNEVIERFPPYGYLEDAIRTAQLFENTSIVNLKSNKVVYRNYKDFELYVNGIFQEGYYTIHKAIEQAAASKNAVIKLNGQAVWFNDSYWHVYQSDQLVNKFDLIHNALAYAMSLENSSIRNVHGQMIWKKNKLQYWAWNGSSKSDVIQSQVNNTKGLNVDSPTWFILADGDGNLTDNSELGTAQWLTKRGVAVHPLVHNQFNRTMTSTFLSNPAAQTKFIDALVKRSVELGVQGINIDFEEVAAKDRDAFTKFVQNFAAAAKKNGLIISIDLPRGSVAWNSKTAYDHAKLWQYVDYIITMAYDQHYSGGGAAGSVSGLQWAEKGIEEFLSYGIPRDKLILGIPFYVREWKMDAAGQLLSNRAIHMNAIPDLLAKQPHVLTWDPAFNKYKAEYKKDGFTFVFWIESMETVKARLDIAKKHQIAGVAAWRLGYESSDLWDMMLQEK